MSAFRLFALTAAIAAVVAGCSTYKQVDDPSDGQNGKYKHHPSGLSR